MRRRQHGKGRVVPPFFLLLALTAGSAAASAQSGRPLDEACRQALASVVEFASDRTTLDGRGRTLVRRQARCLEGQPGAITVEGYWDDSATQSAAVGLSQRLANAVKAELVKSGIDAERIQTVGHGRNRALDPALPHERRRAARVIATP
jgi:outer membrane protein OmpA-like peptidoglycan-associated protein